MNKIEELNIRYENSMIKINNRKEKLQTFILNFYEMLDYYLKRNLGHELRKRIKAVLIKKEIELIKLEDQEKELVEHYKEFQEFLEHMNSTNNE